MNAFTFIRRGISHYKMSYLGVGAGTVLGATVLLGALIAGSSVKETLREVASQRVGQIEEVFVAGEGFFRDGLASEVAGDSLAAAPVLLLRGQLSSQASDRGLGSVQILGVDDRFWGFAPGDGSVVALEPRQVAVNEYLADALDLQREESVVLRLQTPGMLSRDAPLSGEAEDIISFRAKVRAIVGNEQFGRFNLQTTQLPVPTVFVPLSRLQQVVDKPARANMILLGRRPEGGVFSGDLYEHIRSRMVLEDYGLSLVEVPLANATEVRSARIFFDSSMVEAVTERFPSTIPVTSYLVNTYAANGRETPYSMVASVRPQAAPFLPESFSGDEIVINDWLAEDLSLEVGQPISLAFFKLVSGNRLEEDTAEFRVHSIVPREGLAADQLWMPDFPGVAEAEDAQDWAPGLPLDLERIRQKDEDYWDDHRGTPKAFIPEERGRELFGNRWGEFTSLRIPASDTRRPELERELLALLRPEMSGLQLRNLRVEAEGAAESPVPIAMLFLSMSFFLIVASVALSAMLFRFNIEQRNRESGLLAALGIPARKVLRWRLLEGLVIVTLGGLIGLLLAIGYSTVILRVLESIWNEDSPGAFFVFHLDVASLTSGFFLFIALSILAIWVTVRKQARRTASVRLEAGIEEVYRGKVRIGFLKAAAWGCVLLGIGAMAATGSMGAQGSFFLSGVFLLIAGLLRYRAWLGSRGAQDHGELTSGSLAVLNSGRRPMRSLVVVGILACGVFLVIAVTAFQKHGGEEWAERSSGAGGFALWVETTNPINRAADAKQDPDYFEMGEERGLLGEIRPFRLGVGDDASCFNLNKATRPRLLATDSSALAERDSFSLKAVAGGMQIERGWELLRDPAPPRVLRAFIDQTTMMWVLKKKVGDRITYQDEWDVDFEVEITGALADSVFQGSMIVDEEAFLTYFPSQEGYRLFLADLSGTSNPEEARSEIQKATADRGSTVTTTRERLEGFHGVENTYIAIFHVLGGLGLILGSAGLGIVTARNLVERKGEFQLMRTMGIAHRVTRKVIFKEVRAFIGWGLVIGLLASVVAILPALAGTPPLETLLGLGLMVILIAGNSLFWAFVGYAAGYRRRIGVAL
ncbi:MAG: hypothetical protein CMO40_00385 [Verrucomicrobiaceae bacterium]|nr:hypothetical protein [Verrucomicrobiaceae bacterium]